MDALAAAWAATSSWEVVAMGLGVAYIALATRESAWCWVAGFASTAIYVRLFWDASLLMESALQVFYLVMSVVGFWRWRAGGEDGQAPIVRWSPRQHGLALGAIAVATVLSGFVLSRTTSAALPYADSFTTWASVVTTVMVAQKVLGNWVYWIVINIVGIYLYATRGLVLTCALYAVYEVMAVVGLVQWTRSYRKQA
ncbi:MAG: nicotinamide mononucleotide transporter [Myxococcales bacterium]|nr:nicotinamide mononucleotide transporter [Myxococcales bacterium]